MVLILFEFIAYLFITFLFQRDFGALALEE